MVIEKSPTSEVPVELVLRDSIAFENSRRANDAVATRLVTDMRNVYSTLFVARFTRVLSCHYTLQVSDQVTISINVVIK